MQQCVGLGSISGRGTGIQKSPRHNQNTTRTGLCGPQAQQAGRRRVSDNQKDGPSTAQHPPGSLPVSAVSRHHRGHTLGPQTTDIRVTNSSGPT